MHATSKDEPASPGQDQAAQLQLRNQLKALQGRINYAHNYARAMTRRAANAKTSDERAQLLAYAMEYDKRATAAQQERDELKAKHFGTAHPRFHLEPAQRKKAATEARMAQRRKDHGYE